MKKLIACLCLILMLSSCGGIEESKDPNLVLHESSYDEAYQEGFEEGYSFALEYEIDDYQDDINYYEYVKEAATEYACDNSYWHPEEAVWVIEEYRNGSSDYTKQDYVNAIDSLIAFYEYFYNSFYEDLY